MTITRRGFLASSGALLAIAGLPSIRRVPVGITVYKSPTCGCCGEWVNHMKSHGFNVAVHDVSDVTPMKQTMGVPEKLYSCHTAIVGRYIVEGHVPADLVHKMLDTKAAFLGLSVPGMVNGSPGMEGATKDAYDVIAFERGGKTSVYASR
jgi:hypothetical protein